ncbi:putative dihydrodipicolinate synthase [Microstroma glucosiphilum]|uniref:Putative dihydrodipicolinate synthase n=1 Tax=Pseudomicrostroma glucosiphilum TaxID=1684307 RepID=A0A316U9D9_9BASI|nr:putative dihydrodipicolinate synthase [Pseudomicrostroma glucosiphilum]PWN21448.1 putative dihydrodipicolinate synthase [Pseudomicrostroma glucosiphilum]
MNGGRRSLPSGVYAPLPTFFDSNEELDLTSFRKHLTRLAKIDIFPVCAGSLGEAVHLTNEERGEIIRVTRQVLEECGKPDTPIVAGVGGSSTRQTIELARHAAAAGADAGMIILPAYYAASLATDPKQIVQYYCDVCSASPIPILLYNFPANAAGLDMSSDIIEEIASKSPNLAGVKLTCGGSISKLIRLRSPTSGHQESPSSASKLLFLDGLISDLVPWMRVGGHGTVSGISNFAPYATMRLWELVNKEPSALTKDEESELNRIQAILAKADAYAVPAGVRGLKYALARIHGTSPFPRRPLLPLGDQDGEAFWAKLVEMMDLEASLAPQ